MSNRLIRAENDEGGSIDDQPEMSRLRRITSFASIIRGAVVAEKIQEFCQDLEPTIRKTVHEELERSLSQHGHLLHRPPPLQIQDVKTSPSLKLAFATPLLLPIFTNNKLVDRDNKPPEIQLLNTRTNHIITSPTYHLGSPVRLEFLVLDGDFSCSEGWWTSDEFSSAIVRAREGRRPLLVGNLNVAISDHGVAVVNDLAFTDNSSWIRSRNFRIGVRATPGSYNHGPRILEAVSESFIVKDHRGEFYKKHFPPFPTDELWRLKNIGKDGPIHKRLEAEGIKNVQDFLNLHTTDPEKLKKLVSKSDRSWNATVKHAITCDMFRSEGCDSSRTMATCIGDQMSSSQELHPQQMQWDQLEEATNQMVFVNSDRIMAARNLDQASESHESIILSGYQNNRFLETVGTLTSNAGKSEDFAAVSTAAGNDAHVQYSNLPSMETDGFPWNPSEWGQMA